MANLQILTVSDKNKLLTFPIILLAVAEFSTCIHLTRVKSTANALILLLLFLL
jgi:hypothetical protein